MGAYGRFDLQYVRTDRNGTQYFLDTNCPRCSGYGELDKWAYTGRVCFACGGTGKRPQPKTIKVYTPEHEAKLEARRLAKLPKVSEQEQQEREAKAKQMIEEMKINTWLYNGFDREGRGFIHYGDTYKNKDAIKANGGRWCMLMKAYVAPKPIECKGVKIMEVNVSDICTPAGNIDGDKAWEISEAWR